MAIGPLAAQAGREWAPHRDRHRPVRRHGDEPDARLVVGAARQELECEEAVQEQHVELLDVGHVDAEEAGVGVQAVGARRR
jgi:hypothetical protein